MVDKATPVGFLCNFEVLRTLRAMKKEASKPEKKAAYPVAFGQSAKTRLNTVMYEAVKYLENASCGKQSAEQIEKFMLAAKTAPLTKAEKLQFVNWTPQALVDANLMVKDWEDRMAETEMEEIVGLVQECFPDCKKEPEPEAEVEANCDNEVNGEAEETAGVKSEEDPVVEIDLEAEAPDDGDLEEPFPTSDDE